MAVPWRRAELPTVNEYRKALVDRIAELIKTNRKEDRWALDVEFESICTMGNRELEEAIGRPSIRCGYSLSPELFVVSKLNRPIPDRRIGHQVIGPASKPESEPSHQFYFICF